MAHDGDITRLLDAVRTGQSGAQQHLWNVVYAEIHGMARAQFAREAPGRTLQPTALVNEVFLRLFGPSGGDNGSAFENRRHFFAAAAQAMHRIRVDDARTRKRLKRGGANSRSASLPERTNVENNDRLGEPAVFDRDPIDMLALDNALARLEQERPQLAELVRLRYFVELSLDETAEVLGVSRRTVAYQWRLARAWLFGEMSGVPENEANDGDGALGGN